MSSFYNTVLSVLKSAIDHNSLRPGIQKENKLETQKEGNILHIKYFNKKN